MKRFWVPVLVLGVAGFDPVGSFTFVGASALGAAKRNLGVLALTSVLTSWVLSMLAVLGLGETIHKLLDKIQIHPSHVQTSWALLIGGLILLGWGVVRIMQAAQASGSSTDAKPREEGRTPRSLSASGMATAGLLVGVSSLIDPAWYAMVAFASTLDNRAEGMVAGTVWTLMSHILLVVLALSLVVGWYERVERLIETARTRYRKQLGLAITVLLLLGGVGGIVAGMIRLFHA